MCICAPCSYYSHRNTPDRASNCKFEKAHASAAGGRGNAGNTLTVQRILHKDRTSGDLFLFVAHLTVETSVLFIYLFTHSRREKRVKRMRDCVFLKVSTVSLCVIRDPWARPACISVEHAARQPLLLEGRCPRLEWLPALRAQSRGCARPQGSPALELPPPSDPPRGRWRILAPSGLRRRENGRGQHTEWWATTQRARRSRCRRGAGARIGRGYAAPGGQGVEAAR